MALYQQHLRKRPATGEFLAWLRVLAINAGSSTDEMHQALIRSQDNLAELPYLGMLLKNREDIQSLEELY